MIINLKYYFVILLNLKIFLYFFALYDASKIPGFYFYQTDNIKIKFNSPLKKPLCIDGESFDDMSSSYNIKIDHDVYVLMPKKNINSFFLYKFNFILIIIVKYYIK